MITDYFYYLSDYADIGDVEYDQGPIPQNTFHFPFPGKWDEDFFMKTIAYCTNDLVVFSALKENGML